MGGLALDPATWFSPLNLWLTCPLESLQEKLHSINAVLSSEYECRRRMLIKRLDVTVQSFGWSDRAKVTPDQRRSDQPRPVVSGWNPGRPTWVYSVFFEGESGQHGQGLPAQEALSASADLGGRGRAAGSQRRHLQRGEDQQRLQQGEDQLRRQQGPDSASERERAEPDVSVCSLVIFAY